MEGAEYPGKSLGFDYTSQTHYLALWPHDLSWPDNLIFLHGQLHMQARIQEFFP